MPHWITEGTTPSAKIDVKTPRNSKYVPAGKHFAFTSPMTFSPLQRWGYARRVCRPAKGMDDGPQKGQLAYEGDSR